MHHLFGCLFFCLPDMPQVNTEAVKSDIRSAVINEDVFACPLIARLAWHASGTFCSKTNTGGSDGARMRFEPESTDPANAGLGISTLR